MGHDRRSFLRNVAGTMAIAGLPASAEESSQQLKRSLADDPLRPQYHLLPAKNWMNDPNGPIYWKGKYHMFFQYNPHDAIWGDMHWAHAVSEDMLHWKHMPVAIAPTPGGPDADGVFSGTAFVRDGRVGMMYTGVQKPPIQELFKEPSLRETQCIAMADNDDLLSFTKTPQPVISHAPASLQVNGFRDPSPWKQGDWWYTPIASGLANVGGAVLLYRSKDLHVWEFVKIFAQREPTFEAFTPWDVWECPEFFALGDRHVLLFSTMGKAFWQTGRFDEKRLEFHPEKMGILDYGSYYAPKTQLDASGNRILWGWIQEARSSSECQAAGWAGIMSLPRVMTLVPDGTLRFAVAEVAKTLRQDERRLHGNEAGNITVQDCCGEVLYRVSKKFGSVSLEVKTSRSQTTHLRIGFDPAHADQIFIDGKPLQLASVRADSFEIHLYIDGSVIEAFIESQVAWTKRFYYKGPAQDAVLQWRGNGEAIEEAIAWRLQPVSKDRLTT